MFYTSLVLCLWTLVGVFGDEVKSVFVMEGDSVTLYADITEIQSKYKIEWWFKEIRIARIKRSFDIYPIYYDNDKTQRFRDRLKMNNQTADLTIANITTQHTGLYQLYIYIGNKPAVKRFNVTVYVSSTLSITESTQNPSGVFGAEVKSVSVMEGDSVTLHTDITELQSKDDEIEWRFEEIRIARIKRSVNINLIYKDIHETQRFRDRVKLNNQTADLIITNITTQHTGLYTLYMIGNQETIKRFHVTVNAVPTVSIGVFGAEVKSVSVMEGDSVTLHTDITEIQRDDKIEWMFEKIRVARIKRKLHLNPIYDNNDKTQRIIDRLKMNNQTGDLTIINIRSEHTELYTLYNINGHQETMKRFNVTVYGEYHTEHC
ncbi:pregnancy-specific glycoprotein 22-like [Misgurnus anguillicaudatus]|uniref:pregnancy-specific glycoprotein 22-like n=1 Tax=Misgurnus anguillicaudatus TaxID=75329 RepID=UPI003CCFADDF